MSCSICLDTFRNPKLLPCLHTFCRKCLENHAKCKIVNGQANKLNCPLCRHTVCIPSNGINTIFPNYFVRDRRHSPKNICEECNKSVMDTCCHLCDDFLCLDCVRNHRCEFNDKTTELVLSESESEEDDDTDLPIHFRMLLSEANLPATKIQADVVSKFSLCKDPKGTARVTSILPLHQGGALVVINNGPDVICYDRDCHLIEQYKVGNGIRDIASGPRGRIFLLQDTTNSILELRDKKVQWFTSLPCDGVLAMSFFPDGRSVVMSVQDTSERFNRNLRTNTREKRSQMVILQSDGQVSAIHGFQRMTLTEVVVIPKLNSVCISDTSQCCLIFCLCDGTVLGHYGLMNQLNPMGMTDHISFVPRGLCCDGDENIIMYDRMSGSLHLIDSTGHLVTFIETKSPLGLGSPETIRMAPDGNLWIGDSESSTIRILKICKFKNSFRLPD